MNYATIFNKIENSGFIDKMRCLPENLATKALATQDLRK